MQDECCEYCEGELEQRRVLARFRYKGETIYIEHVPAWVCKQCGEQYYDAPVYKQMERIAQQREQIQRVISFPLAEFEMVLSG
ncbi:MAG: YgiT-type zinc finger protein [Caldilineaceae bacterium]